MMCPTLSVHFPRRAIRVNVVEEFKAEQAEPNQNGENPYLNSKVSWRLEILAVADLVLDPLEP
jgi:hypothetical protein